MPLKQTNKHELTKNEDYQKINNILIVDDESY